ncbi:P-loop containing nucleoside triphosphate hydrolase protein [Mycena haematopus]|nr:P-loop containing nucleoside triphosphate hydrolase protein [Mycena haematopus]
MTRVLRWQDPLGRDTINKIVKKLIPAWQNGLRPVQEDLVAAMLDGDDVLCCTATGDGKSAAFSVPILVLNEYNAHRDLYPAGLPTRSDPVGMVVTPTKGLAANIVLELTKLGISAFAYSRESLADARRRGVICVDPEHLKSKEWREISDSPKFRSQLVYTVTDEAHLINEWGVDFRVDFKSIGIFVRGRLPPSISVVALSATLAPGRDTKANVGHLDLSSERAGLWNKIWRNSPTVSKGKPSRKSFSMASNWTKPRLSMGKIWHGIGWGRLRARRCASRGDAGILGILSGAHLQLIRATVGSLIAGRGKDQGGEGIGFTGVFTSAAGSRRGGMMVETSKGAWVRSRCSGGNGVRGYCIEAAETLEDVVPIGLYVLASCGGGAGMVGTVIGPHFRFLRTLEVSFGGGISPENIAGVVYW